MKRLFLIILTLSILFISPFKIQADEKDDRIAELEAQIVELQKIIDDLTARLAVYEPNETAELNEEGITFILNTKSKKIHKIHGVDTDTIADENRQATDKTLDELIELGYSTCGRCF